MSGQGLWVETSNPELSSFVHWLDPMGFSVFRDETVITSTSVTNLDSVLDGEGLGGPGAQVEEEPSLLGSSPTKEESQLRRHARPIHQEPTSLKILCLRHKPPKTEARLH